MQCLIVLLLLGQIAGADGVSASARNARLQEIIARHRALAVSRLKDDDPDIASAALDALATLDCDSYIDLLRQKLSLPLADPSLAIAIGHLIGRATPNDLRRVQDIVGEAAKKGEEERKKDPYLVDAAFIEFLALEVLLASGSPEAVQFAARYLEETIARNPGPGITQMELALDLTGRYVVKAAAAKVRVDAREELRDAALSALAKNGDQSALDTLKTRVKTMQSLGRIVFDSQLVDKMGLTEDELRAVYQKGDRPVRIATAGQLARMGHMQELHVVTQDVLATSDPVSVVLVESMIGRYGDASFVRDLDSIASEQETLVGRLNTSRAIFQVVRRAKSPPPRPRGRKTG